MKAEVPQMQAKPADLQQTLTLTFTKVNVPVYLKILLLLTISTCIYNNTTALHGFV